MARSTTRARQLAKIFDIGLLNIQDGSLVTGNAVTDSATVTAISLDSAEAIALIDSAYVQARQDFAYSSLTGVPSAGTDSATVISLINQNSLDSAEVISLIDSAYVALRAPSGGTDSATVISLISQNSIDSSGVLSLIDSAYVAARSAAGGVDSAATNSLIDAKIEIIDIADIIGATGNSGEYLKSLGNGNAEWSTFESVIDSAYIQLRQSSVGTGGLDSSLVTQLIDSAYVQLRQTDLTGLDSALTTQLIDSAYIQLRQDFAYSSLTGTPTVLDSALVTQLIDSAYVALRAPSAGTDSATVLSLIGANSLDSAETISLIDSAYVEARQNFAYGALTGKPTILDSANITNLIDSAYVALRAPAAAGGIDSAAANTLIDAKVQVLNIADIVGATGNPGEYLKSLGSGNAEWSTISAGTDSATVISLINANSIDSVGVLGLIDSAYIAARTSAGTDSSSVIALINEHSVDSTEALALFTGGTGVTVSTGTISIGQAVGTSDSVTFAGLTVSGNLTVNGTTTTVNTEIINLADNIIVLNSNEAGTPSQNGGIEVERGTSTNVSLLWNETSDTWTFTNDGSNYYAIPTPDAYLNSSETSSLIDSTYVQARQDFAYSSLTGTPFILDSTNVLGLIDSAYVAARAPAASGGIDSAAANTLIDAKVQVLNIADIVGATGNSGEYLKSLGSGNATWENVTTVIDSAYVAARAPAGGLSTWQKKTADYTLSAGDRIAVNTDSAWTMTLPASPTFSDEVYIIDATGNAAVKNITVSGNSQKILASDSDLIINVNRASVALMFYGDSQGWILTSAF